MENYYYQNEDNIENYQKCQCGAITFMYENGESYSCYQRNLKKFFPQIDLRRLKKKRLISSYCCNHCVNKWGLDLDYSGNGEKIIQNKTISTVKASQILGQFTHPTCKGAWI